MAEGVFLTALLTPFVIEYAIADPIRRISPPLKPLRGSWKSSRAFKSSLEFMGNEVQYRATTRKGGRWSVNAMNFTWRDAEPELITRFHFQCGELVLDNPVKKLRDWSEQSRAIPRL